MLLLELIVVGWKECTQLSTSNSVTNGPAQNAGKTFPRERSLMNLKQDANFVIILDTWALFASICWQLQQGLITGVNSDGTISTA